MKDLVVLVPDQDYEKAIEGLFSRYRALGIKALEFNVYRHTNRDAGCRTKCASFLRSFNEKYEYALVLFDLEGSGADNCSREDIEFVIETELSQNGWGERSAAIVVDPEIEAWVWSDSPEVDAVLNWHRCEPDIRSAIRVNTEYWADDTIKPQRPKEALRWALRNATIPKPFSSSIFNDLGRRVGINRCVDPAFGKLKLTLRNWFGAQNH